MCLAHIMYFQVNVKHFNRKSYANVTIHKFKAPCKTDCVYREVVCAPLNKIGAPMATTTDTLLYNPAALQQRLVSRRASCVIRFTISAASYHRFYICAYMMLVK